MNDLDRTMKTKFFWITVLTLLLSSQTWSQYAPKNIQSGSSFERPGVDDEDKNFIMKDAEQGLQEHKKENGGKINLTKFKPVAIQALYETFQAEEITRKELMEIRNAYQKLEKDSKNMDQAQIEKNLRAVFKKLFEKIQNTKLQCTAAGKQCNNWGCCKGLVCAAVPERARVQMNQCKRFRSECRQDSECCSGECVESYVDGPESVGLPGVEERHKSFKKAKKKVCAAVRRCFKPGKVGAACDRNPVCGEGQCLPVNRGILGINECSRSGNECSSNDQCCSNKCNRGKCVENFICKNCIGQGIRPKRGQKCCEGLYKDPDSNKCIREMPPFVLPQVKVLPMKKSIIALVASFFISEANAGDQQTRETETSRAKNAAENDTKLQQKLMMQQGGFGTIPGQLEKDAKYKDHELAQFDVREGSDFDKCEIDLKADYLIRLRDYGQDGNGIGGINNAIGMEMALMAFEYMLLGKGTEDYWLAEKNKSNTNIYQRMRKVAKIIERIVIQSLKISRSSQKDFNAFVGIRVDIQNLMRTQKKGLGDNALVNIRHISITEIVTLI